MANFFIRRPIVAMVIAILMVLMGIVAMRRLPTAQFPNIAPPEIQVKATYPGRGCRNRGAVRSHPDRAANERRGQHELHVLQQRQ